MKTCKDCNCEINDKIRCVDCQKQFKHKIYLRNKENQMNRQKIKYKENSDEMKNYAKDYYQNNKEKHNETCKTYKKKKRKEDPIYKFRENIRGVIGRGFRSKSFDKNSITYDILGCDFDTFKQHIESLWEQWMNWDNYGIDKRSKIEPNKTWDIDHIIPLNNGNTEKEIIELNHYTNLQPLCSHYNRFIKGTNLE